MVREVSPAGLGSTASAMHLCIRNLVGGLGPIGVALLSSKVRWGGWVGGGEWRGGRRRLQALRGMFRCRVRSTGSGTWSGLAVDRTFGCLLAAAPV